MHLDFVAEAPPYCRVEWVKKGSEHQPLLVFMCPHGAYGADFLQDFIEIFNTMNQQQKKSFEEYIKIEQDQGAWEWTQGVAQSLAATNLNLQIMTILLDYPRGILDGGRRVEYCISDMLPKETLSLHREAWAKIQCDVMSYMEKIYAEICSTGGLLLDLHTMAPRCQAPLIPRVWSELDAYLQSYHHSTGPKRVWDVITGEGPERILADSGMTEVLCEVLAEKGIDYRINDPYPAAPPYLMHVHMSSCPALAIDIPKTDFVISEQCFALDHVKVDPVALQSCVDPVVESVKRWLSKKEN